ncbi:Cyp6u1, partial [Drosophila busckii]
MELMQRVFFTALSALTVCYALIKFSLGYWKRRGILHEKPKFLWGNIKGVVSGKRHISEALHTIYESYKGRAPFVGCYALLKPYILVLDLKLAQQILVSHAGHFTSRGLYNNVDLEPLSGNLLQLDGHKWRSLHAQSSQVFTNSNIQKLLPRLLQLSRQLQFRLGEQKLQGLNISKLVNGYNTDVIAALAYGLLGEEPQFNQLTHCYWQNFSLWRNYLALEFPLLARLFQHRSYEPSVMDYFHKLALTQLDQQRRRDRQPLQTFLQLYTQAELRETQIAAQAFSFILAGLSPLNATLSFCLYELALQPELQERLRTEINKVLGQHKGELTAECLQDLIYAKQTLKETLRLHTPYAFLIRRTTKDFEVAKSVFMLARGNNIVIPVAAIHRDPSIYADPLRFDPDRFNPSAELNRSAMSFLPFGAGLRGCIAQQFAEKQLLIGLVNLLQHHKYAPCAETQIPLQYDTRKLLLVPKVDIQLSVERVS